MLWILNRVLGAGNEYLVDPKPVRALPSIGQRHLRMNDFFHFSKMSQGILLSSQFRIDNDPFICLMFKFEWGSVFQDAQANGGHLSMVLLSILQHKNDKGDDLSERNNCWNI